MGVTIAVAAIAVTSLLALQFSEGQSQSFTCFTGTSCDGASVSSSDSESCCFGTGYSYNDGSSCQTCIVIGWKNASMPDGSINRAMEFELDETSLAHTFLVGCLKGDIEFAVFNVGPETTSDYDIRPRQLTLFRCNDVNVMVFLQVDNIAMEQDERISLTLTKTDGDPSLEVFVINVIIIDSDVVNLGFNEDDYAETEANGVFNVVVRQLQPRKILDSDIVLRLIPVNYTYANNRGFYTGDEIPLDKVVPNRAVGGVDYNDSIVYCTFPAGNVTPFVNNQVVIYDDTVDEDRQFFFVHLQVESATHQNRVNLATSITKCNIDDNDDTHLSFEFSSYSVNETGTGLFLINIIKQKENATATENTYELTVQLKSTSSEMVTRLDFIAPNAKLAISPNQEKVIYSVTIHEDGVPEEEESFSLSISPIPNEVQWVNGDYVNTIINIIDDDEIPVFGFVNPNVTVSEGIGIYIQNVIVYVPIPKKQLSGEFLFLLSSVDISASIAEDYAVTGIGVFGGFNDSIRDKSVRISITDDSKLEEDEVFYLSLRRLPLQPTSILKPSIATFIIMDNDHARVGLESTFYTVDKNKGVVEICARVFEPDISCPIDFAFNLTFDTINGSAVSTKDYIGVSTVLMFDRCAIRRCVNISIVDDTIPENTEYFTVMIGGMPNLHPNISLSPTKANITIPDNDAIVVGYNKTNYITTEGQNVVLVAVIQPPGTRAIRRFTIAVSTSDDTADGGSDYTPVMMHQLVFNIGDMYQNHTITILDDRVCERNPNEQFFSDLVYVSGQMPIKIDPNRATVVIDDFNATECDVIVVGYNTTNYITTEGQKVVLFAVIQPPGARAPRRFTIAASTSDDTADGGFDYTPVMMHQLVFNTGDMYQSHTITILDDLECKRNPNEQFFSDLVYVSGQKPINIVPNRATVVIDDFNATECEVIIGFVKTEYTVSEGDKMAVVSVEILQGTLRSNITIQFFTEDDSATSSNRADYTETVRNITFKSGLGKGHVVSISIPIIEDNIAENNEKFFVGLSLISPSFNVRVHPGRAMVNITDDDKMGVFVNGTLTGDPLMTVPIYADPDVDQDSVHTSLCYEIHGKENKSFNLISDKCTSVNAHYAKAVVIGSNSNGSTPSVPDINVVNTIGIKAAVMVNGSKMCYNIRVGPDNCQVTLNDVDVSTKRQLNGISIHEFNNRVRIAVPNCGKTTLVMWIFCMDGTTEDLITKKVFPFRMMRFVVMRGLNLAPTSHGLIGQFWNVPVSVTEFDGDFGGTSRSDDYLIRLSDPISKNERSFVGIKADITWEFEKRPCLYVGNSQGGPIDEVESPNDSVIEGDYTKYEVGSLFATAFRFGQFIETECINSISIVS